MSFQAMAWAVGLTLSSREKFVLLMLSNFADENGMAWPSISTLCKITGMSRHTVIEAIKVLEKDNYIKAVRQNFQGTNLPNRYQLQIAPVVQNLHHPLVQEMHHPSAPNAPEPIIEPIIYNNPPYIPPKGKTKAHPLPEDWKPSEEDRFFAESEGVDVDREFQVFRNYWLSKGKNDTKSNWSLTWRNWCMKAEKKKPPRVVPLIDGEVPISEAFPPSGTIRYSRYADFVRSLGTGLDPDWIADRFRPWAESKGIALDGPDVIRAFKGFARAQKRN